MSDDLHNPNHDYHTSSNQQDDVYHESRDPDKTHSGGSIPQPNSSQTWQRLSAVEAYETPYERPTPREPVYVSQQGKTPPPPPPLARESAARSRVRRRQSRSRGSEWAWVIVAASVLVTVVLVGISAVLLLQDGESSTKITPTATLNVAALPPAVDFREPVNPSEADSGDAILLNDGSVVELKPWSGDSRFTILAMGIDRRPGETDLTHLTDTMMLISINPPTQSIGILSIPRDMYVPVPGYSELQRINTPMVLGEVRQPGSGPQLAMQTVQNNLGIRVHEYLVVDFRAVIDLINAIGGIEVTIDYTINDPQYPDMNFGYDPFYLPAGTHQLDGERALKFARTRHGDNDIARADRQQQVLYAVRDKVMRLDMLAGLIAEAPSLMNSLDDNIHTGLTMQEMIQLAWYVKDVPREKITTNVIDFSYLRPYTTTSGDQVLIPNRSKLGELMVETFGPNYSE